MCCCQEQGQRLRGLLAKVPRHRPTGQQIREKERSFRGSRSAARRGLFARGVWVLRALMPPPWARRRIGPEHVTLTSRQSRIVGAALARYRALLDAAPWA